MTSDRPDAFDRPQHRREQSKQRRLQKGKEPNLKQVMRARWRSLKRTRSPQRSNHNDHFQQVHFEFAIAGPGMLLQAVP